jgi:TolB protein
MNLKILDRFGWGVFKYLILVSSILLFITCDDEEKPWWWVPETIADYPCWTPDGSKIAYCREHQIWITDTLGNTWNMFDDTTYESELLDFSPDGKWMVYVSGVHIYKARVTDDWKIIDTSITRLTEIGKNFFPKWSPKTNHITFDSNAHDTSQLLYRIWLMTSNGNDKKMVTTVGGRQPDWSPSGNRIVYYGFFDESDASEIVIISSEGSNPKRLTSDSIWDSDPAWSPDGYRIAFSRIIEEKEGGISYIYLIDTTGTNLSNLTSGLHPAWAPTGNKLAFSTLEPEGEYVTIFTIDIQSKKTKQLVFREE